jgi:hypothetical protein
MISSSKDRQRHQGSSWELGLGASDVVGGSRESALLVS